MERFTCRTTASQSTHGTAPWFATPRRIASPALGLLMAAASHVAHAGPALTVYTRDLGFVRETRTLVVESSRDTVRLPDVSERLDFSSVRLVPEGDARIARLAYRWDVASGDGVLERARGGRVRVALRGDRVVEGTLIAVDGAWLTVREDDGAVHTLARTAVEDVRIVGVAGLALRPALEAVIDTERRGRLRVDLSYLTGGLSWSAEHTLVRVSESRGSWSAVVNVENTTGRDWVDATLKLVAGEPSRVGAPPPIPLPGRAMMMEMSMAKQEADLSEQNFSEYHLYTLGRFATLRDRETQRLTMIEPRGVGTSPRYLYRGGDPRGVRAQLEIVNDAKNGLGVPLPAGRVRIYDTDPDGDLQFVGESTIRHTPEGEKVTLEVGAAFDLAAERRELYQKRISDREREYAVVVELRNRKKTAVTIVVEEGVAGDVDITQPSHPFTRKDASTIQFTVQVPAGRTVEVRYTARARY